MRVASAAGVSPFGGARRCLTRRANGAANPVACIDHAAHPPGTMPIAPTGDCRPWRAGGSGTALPPQHGESRTADPCRQAPHRGCSAPPVSGRGAASPAAPWARRFRVADTSRTTRSADQPSSCIHDRPAVNGRAQSPSRLKPADPNGQPIDSGAWAPHSPLQGAWGFSPGLKPRADGWRPPPP
jgi:hypothetical protein